MSVRMCESRAASSGCAARGSRPAMSACSVADTHIDSSNSVAASGGPAAGGPSPRRYRGRGARRSRTAPIEREVGHREVRIAQRLRADLGVQEHVESILGGDLEHLLDEVVQLGVGIEIVRLERGDAFAQRRERRLRRPLAQREEQLLLRGEVRVEGPRVNPARSQTASTDVASMPSSANS